mgnify:CR=1 FL=1
MRAVLLLLAMTYVMPPGSVLRRVAAARDEMTLAGLKVDGLGAVSPVVVVSRRAWSAFQNRLSTNN